MTETLTQGDAGVYVQWLPGMEKHFLGNCIDLDSLPNPRQGGETIFCWAPGRKGFQARGRRKTTPGDVEFTLSHLLETQASFLHTLDWDTFRFYGVIAECSTPEVFGNWSRAAAYEEIQKDDDPFTAFAAHAEDGDIMHEYSLSGPPPRYDFLHLRGVERDPAYVRPIQALCMNRESGACAGAPPRERYHTWFAAETLIAAAAAIVKRSTDYGVTWTAVTSPFGINIDIQALAMFEISSGVDRVLAFADTQAGNPLQVAISDDNGATWAIIDIGSTNGEYLENQRCVFVGDSRHIWVGTDQGIVYFSSNGGVTWTQQATPAAVAGNVIQAVRFAGSPNEYHGIIVTDAASAAITSDGENWIDITATLPAFGVLYDAAIFSQYIFMLFGDNGAGSSVQMTYDGGETYQERFFSGSTTDTVYASSFINSFEGVILTDADKMYQTIDGGDEWLEFQIPAGLTAGPTSYVLLGSWTKGGFFTSGNNELNAIIPHYT